jgi:hypothetical protein
MLVHSEEEVAVRAIQQQLARNAGHFQPEISPRLSIAGSTLRRFEIAIRPLTTLTPQMCGVQNPGNIRM